MKTTEEQFDDFVARRSAVHAAEIYAKLGSGDPKVTADIDESIGTLLNNSSAWADMIKKAALGRNPFSLVMWEAIKSTAEILAIKDAEKAERDREQSRQDMLVDLAIDGIELARAS